MVQSLIKQSEEFGFPKLLYRMTVLKVLPQANSLIGLKDFASDAWKL
jgi:hypothetical protein